MTQTPYNDDPALALSPWLHCLAFFGGFGVRGFLGALEKRKIGQYAPVPHHAQPNGGGGTWCRDPAIATTVP